MKKVKPCHYASTKFHLVIFKYLFATVVLQQKMSHIRVTPLIMNLRMIFL